MERTIQVVITDPHPVVVSGIRSFFSGRGDVRIVGDCSELHSACKICLDTNADVLLVGHTMDEAGWKLLSRLRKSDGSFVSVMAMTSLRDPHSLCQVLRGGCRGVYDKADPLEQLPDAIRSIHGGTLWFRDKDAHHVMESLLKQERGTSSARKNSAELTERQQRIISMIARGLTNAEIAEAVRVSQATVALDLTRIYKRFGVPDRVRLLLKLRAEGTPMPSGVLSRPPFLTRTDFLQ